MPDKSQIFLFCEIFSNLALSLKINNVVVFVVISYYMYCFAALSILHQHAIQGDMSELQLAAVRWLAYSRVHPSVDPRLLYKLLAALENIWPMEALSREEVRSTEILLVISHLAGIATLSGFS